MKNVLITGSEGALGKFVNRSFRYHFPEYNIIGVDVKNPISNENDEYYYGDLTSDVFVSILLHNIRPDYIVHCAARWNGLNYDESICKDNISMTNNILRHVDKEKIKHFSYLSSSAVYGDSNRYDMEEDLVPNSSYGVSKLTCEKLVKADSERYGFSYTIWRPFHIVSPEEMYNPGSSHICTDFCYKIIDLGQRMQIDFLSDVKKIPLTWVEDVSDCIVKNIGNSSCINQTFNIGTPEMRSVRDVAVEIIIVANTMGLINWGSNLVIDESDFDMHTGFNKLSRDIGWTAETLFKESVEKFIDYKYGRKDVRN